MTVCSASAKPKKLRAGKTGVNGGSRSSERGGSHPRAVSSRSILLIGHRRTVEHLRRRFATEDVLLDRDADPG